MTFSLCVHETVDDDDGTPQDWFGVAITTRLPGVGTNCPYANRHAAIATQSLSNPALGRRGIDYVRDGLAIEDALEALLNADAGRASRQVHGVSSTGTFAFTGDSCRPWSGHHEGPGYTVAGNMLAGEEVIRATAEAYEAGDPALALPERLIDALAAGQAAGGDGRTDLRVQSAAVRVETTTSFVRTPATHDLRVDATETPIDDLRLTHELALEGHEAALERYGEFIRADTFDVDA